MEKYIDLKIHDKNYVSGVYEKLMQKLKKILGD